MHQHDSRPIYVRESVFPEGPRGTCDTLLTARALGLRASQAVGRSDRPPPPCEACLSASFQSLGRTRAPLTNSTRILPWRGHRRRTCLSPHAEAFQRRLVVRQAPSAQALSPQSVHVLLLPFDALFEAVPVEGEMVGPGSRAGRAHRGAGRGYTLRREDIFAESTQRLPWRASSRAR